MKISLVCRSFSRSLLLVIGLSVCSRGSAEQAPPVRVAIVGLVHGHVEGLFEQLPQHPEVVLVGIADPDAGLRQKYISSRHLDPHLFYPSETAMLDATHPQAILVYTSIAGHRAAIEEAAQRHIAAMVEKPLATTLADALTIRRMAEQNNVPVIVNYETTWYPSNRAAQEMLASGKLGELRKLVVHDGHSGPKEIGVSPEFLGWLTDPKENGAGALFDFGCYGADLATWLMKNQVPNSVTAVTQQLQPEIYPHVDDEGTIILTYPHAQVIIQASWNWPFDRKDMEVYGATGYVDTVRGDGIRVRLKGDKEARAETAPPIPAPEDGSLHYLAAVINGSLPHERGDLSSLDTNITVMRILEAARESARTGRTVVLARDAK
jgi:glucose-fructose oxidoreductase